MTFYSFLYSHTFLVFLHNCLNSFFSHLSIYLSFLIILPITNHILYFSLFFSLLILFYLLCTFFTRRCGVSYKFNISVAKKKKNGRGERRNKLVREQSRERVSKEVSQVS